MASSAPFVPDEEQAPVEPVSSSEDSDKEPAATANWSRRVAAGLAACTATYAAGRVAMHSRALDSGVVTVAGWNVAAPAHHPALRAMSGGDDEPTFETGDAGSSHVYPQQAGELRKGSHVMIKGHACKVTEITTSKTGKHGHAKAHIIALDIFTGKKYEDLCPASHNVEVPFVKRTEYQVLTADPNSGEVSLLTESGETKDDLTLPDRVEIGEPTDDDKKLSQALVDVVDKFVDKGEKDVMAIVLDAIGKEKIVDYKLKEVA